MRSRALAPVLLLTAVLVTAAVWSWALHTRHARERRAPVPVRAETAEVLGLAGEGVVAGGGRLSVRIVRLHHDSERQRFDAQALRKRFGLAEGEPFQCILTLRGADDRTTTGHGIVLANARVEDEQGLALGVFDTPLPGSTSAPADPLATLVSPPSESLQEESSVSILMWGREPAAHPRLVVTGVPDIEVSATRLSTRDLETALARIDSPSARTDLEGDRR